jgi:Lar family restriction alleviation protein
MINTILDKIAALVDHPPLVLKACPFCGRSAVVSKFVQHWMVECEGFSECGCHGPIRDTAADAAEAWNMRSE